jgi:hypothetical protein
LPIVIFSFVLHIKRTTTSIGTFTLAMIQSTMACIIRHHTKTVISLWVAAALAADVKANNRGARGYGKFNFNLGFMTNTSIAHINDLF